MNLKDLATAKRALRSTSFVIVLTIALFLSSAASADSADASPRMGRWFPTECPETILGPGATPSDAILIDEHKDVLVSAKFWGASADQQKEIRSYFDEDEIPPLDLNCRFVKIAGYFRHRPYHHYRGVLTSSARDFYLGDIPGNFIREGVYFVESWADDATESVHLNGSDVTLIARHYDLCRAAREAERQTGEFLFTMSGPCHYGDFTGLMLSDVRVIESKNPFQRVRGEANRKIIGDLRQLPSNWPDYKYVRRAAQDWLDAVRAGAESYYELQYAPGRFSFSEQTRIELLKRALDDRDDWIWFLAKSPESPVRSQNPPLESRPFAIFENVTHKRGRNRDAINAVVACFCSKDTCDDDWPIFDADSEYFFESYVCLSLTRNRDRPEVWKW